MERTVLFAAGGPPGKPGWVEAFSIACAKVIRGIKDIAEQLPNLSVTDAMQLRTTAVRAVRNNAELAVTGFSKELDDEYLDPDQSVGPDHWAACMTDHLADKAVRMEGLRADLEVAFLSVKQDLNGILFKEENDLSEQDRDLLRRERLFAQVDAPHDPRTSQKGQAKTDVSTEVEREMSAEIDAAISNLLRDVSKQIQDKQDAAKEVADRKDQTRPPSNSKQRKRETEARNKKWQEQVVALGALPIRILVIKHLKDSIEASPIAHVATSSSAIGDFFMWLLVLYAMVKTIEHLIPTEADRQVHGALWPTGFLWLLGVVVVALILNCYNTLWTYANEHQLCTISQALQDHHFQMELAGCLILMALEFLALVIPEKVLHAMIHKHQKHRKKKNTSLGHS
ncbi:MAG: hypothetical protein JNL52_15355 [Flavobacteriales bacterium]|nr:hypothetical protein [Flavobacteriales bacterium]